MVHPILVYAIDRRDIPGADEKFYGERFPFDPNLCYHISLFIARKGVVWAVKFL